MKKVLLFIALLPLLINAQPLHVKSPVRFLALGDSYTIGESVPSADNWPNQLRDSLAVRNITTDTLRIIATTGWRTDNLISAITNQGLDSGHFNLVGLLIGVNNQYQGRPISQYITEFPQLVDSAIRYAGGDTSHVFIVSIPDYAYTPFGIQSGDTATISMQLDTYNLLNHQFADSFHIKYFDITPISRMGLAEPDLVAGDGLHPSAKQYAMWVQLMLQSIDTASSVITGTGAIPQTGEVKIYPNPVADHVIISVGELSSNTSFHLFNTLGQEVLQQTLQDQYNSVSIAWLPDDLYMARIITGNSVSVTKIVKRKE